MGFPSLSVPLSVMIPVLRNTYPLPLQISTFSDTRFSLVWSFWLISQMGCDRGVGVGRLWAYVDASIIAYTPYLRPTFHGFLWPPSTGVLFSALHLMMRWEPFRPERTYVDVHLLVLLTNVIHRVHIIPTSKTNASQQHATTPTIFFFLCHVPKDK